MSDSYQAIYDAVRSRVHGGNIGEAVAEVARQSFDISQQVYGVAQAAYTAVDTIRWSAEKHGLPSAVYRPAISKDGDQWCALYGANLMEGVAGFGDTPALAMADFDKAWASTTGVSPQLPSPEEA